MKFSKRQDIDAPMPAVFAAVSDFPAFERLALRRGIEVARRDDLETPATGMAWDVRAPIRGRVRDISITLTRYLPETELTLLADSGGIRADMAIELVELSRSRTRLHVGIELRASSIASRLLLQSMKLAKASLDRRFAKRVADFASDIENRQRKAGRPA